MTEFDAGRDYTKTRHVLRAIEWGIQAWESVDSTLITGCWQKGFKELKEEPENNCWAESLELIQEIQGIASSLATSDQRIKEPADIRSFIQLEEERVVDSEEDVTDQIIAHYSPFTTTTPFTPHFKLLTGTVTRKTYMGRSHTGLRY